LAERLFEWRPRYLTSFFNPFGPSLPNTNWVPKKAQLRRWQIGKSPRTQQPGSPCFDLNTPPLPSHAFPPRRPRLPPLPLASPFPQFLPLFALRAAATLPLRGLQIHLLFPPWRAAPCLAAPARRGAVRRVGRGFLDLAVSGGLPRSLVGPGVSWRSRQLAGWRWLWLVRGRWLRREGWIGFSGRGDWILAGLQEAGSRRCCGCRDWIVAVVRFPVSPCAVLAFVYAILACSGSYPWDSLSIHVFRH